MNSRTPATAHHIGGPSEIQPIPIDRIRVLNPRSRNQKVFASLVESIATVGLKRPITVTASGNGEPLYDLVCGQGRMEAFKVLGETTIPAVVVQADEADLYLISLIENLARRKHSNRDLLTAVRVLEERGYGAGKIAQKTGLDSSYINGILVLLKAGEERLIAAVEKGWLPINLASQIARAGDEEIQVAMMQAYETGLLRGEQLIQVRRLIDRRRVMGKQYGRWAKTDVPVTPRKLLQTYQTEVRRRSLLVKKAEIGEQRLLFVVTTLRRLLADEHFRTLLRAEGIDDLPKVLSDRLPREARP
ncbi:ParB N-terminal domain-containing protein [Azospirillum sp. RWY-5-1]|uniref:ParB N-terminal domain-containing protein n=1 Tax=Azospirillum oleiclasticum TaxID=2735135 RepID=A0ABX2TC01_9PROT|nr:plasmid partitioning protein RepB C-terminal domain-containing protein [Azospirillum oleiclasticum]NYZ16888.1 ParB N-terminal domain-containing protein [Azospirillum oleiclasticum]NYZ21825.1 ParB N-terminal domain-containing protein [Azospirillum oleiclasticum]